MIAGGLIPLFLGEIAMRLRPPTDLLPYLGDESPLTGIYVPDATLKVAYRSAAEYQPYEAPKLADLHPLNTPGPTWLFLGNSFARGLSASVRPRLSDHRVLFYRESKDEFHMRIGQLRLLLENNLRPTRIFFTLIPSEVARYANRPLEWVQVNKHGGLGSSYRKPGEPLNSILEASWLARLGWVRSRLHSATPGFRASRITEEIPKTAEDSFRTMFTALGKVSQQYQIPVTLVLLPERRQVFNGSNYALQSILTPLALDAGLDVFDPREGFLKHPDKKSLYLPDWHYSPEGDELLLSSLLLHLKQQESIQKGGKIPR